MLRRTEGDIYFSLDPLKKLAKKLPEEIWNEEPIPIFTFGGMWLYAPREALYHAQWATNTTPCWQRP